jgi:DNA-binding response OmpR family regulator
MPADPGSATVLVIDDDPQMRSVIRRFLENEGYRVIEDGSADHAIQALDSIRPDVIILDRIMPGMKGTEFITAVNRRRLNIPIILITAFGGPDVEADALRRGAAFYLEKPFRMSLVVHAVNRLTRRPHASRTSDIDR